MHELLFIYDAVLTRAFEKGCLPLVSGFMVELTCAMRKPMKSIFPNTKAEFPDSSRLLGYLSFWNVRFAGHFRMARYVHMFALMVSMLRVHLLLLVAGLVQEHGKVEFCTMQRARNRNIDHGSFLCALFSGHKKLR